MRDLEAYKPPEGVINKEIASHYARDAAPDSINSPLNGYGAFGAANAYPSWLADGLGFQGYPYLAEMAQRAEFRKPCDVLARECFREWIRITHASEEDNDDEKGKIQAIEDAFKRFNVRSLLHKMTHDALVYGVGHIWLNVKNASRNATGQNVPLTLAPQSIKKGMLGGFTVPEAIWCTPNAYNADDPLDRNYYKPVSWWCQGKLIHHSRFLQMIPYQVSDLFKPSFNFGGLSLMQMIKADVHNYLRIRNSAANITANFSKLVLKTNMTASMATPGTFGQGDIDSSSLLGRANFLQQVSEGQDTIIADKESEEISIIATPLGGLSELQVKAMEKMASFPGIPLVKLFGITPSGLNASSEEEIRVFYDEIASFQEAHIRPILEAIFKLIQLDAFGEIDPRLGFEFQPLWQMSEAEQINIIKEKVGIDAVNIEGGVITPEESRQRQNKDRNGIYQDIDLSGEAPHREEEGEEPDDDPPPNKKARDEAFKEGEHPRDKSGKFTSGESPRNSDNAWINTGEWKAKASSFDRNLAFKKAQEPDKNNFTRVGRAWQKHSNRKQNNYEPAKGSPWKINEEGLKRLEGIFNDPTARIFAVPETNIKDVGYHILADDGKGAGAHFHPDHYKVGFREPATKEQLEILEGYDNEKLKR